MVNLHRIGSFVSLVVLFLNVSISDGTIVLPQTGQTTCWDEDGVELTSCDGTGQDGDILAGANWPIPRFTDNGDGTMTDNLTSLMWLKDANCANTISHDPDATGNGSMNWDHALDFVAGINAGTHAACGGGKTGWRLPNVNELESLLYLETDDTSEWLETSGFTNVSGGGGFYWSSTTFENITTQAWTVFIEGEFNNSFFKNTDFHRAWPVRDSSSFSPAPVWKTGQVSSYAGGDDGDIQAGVSWPGSRFADIGDGTVTDNLTGLMWLKDANCMKTHYASFDTDGINGDGRVSWQHALDFVAGINDGTHSDCGIVYTDWRLANWKELHSLTDFSQYDPALPATHPFTKLPGFPLTPEYWSSTTSLGVGGGDAVWLLDLKSGLMADFYLKKTSNSYVWPVRAGTLPPDITVTDSIPSDADLRIPFGKVLAGNYSDQTLTITNDGSSDLIIGDIAQADALSIPFSVVDDNCSGQTLAQSANCTIGIRYSPTSTDIITDTLDIPSNDPNENPVIVEASGGYYLELAQTGQDTKHAPGDDGEVQAGVAWATPRFTDNGDGTVSDNLTGLMWLKDANCFGLQSWENALTTVAGFNSSPATYDCASYDESSPPHTDWRPPNVNELESLTHAGYDGIDCGGSLCSSNAEWLNTQDHVNVQTNSYWSSTTDTLFKGEARTVDMSDGSVYRVDKSLNSTIWPVRAGQVGSPDPGYPANIWKTGQTDCYDALGGGISCSNTGQDGDLQAGVTWPSPRFSDNGDGTVRDNLTGLIWLKDANCMETQYAGFDNDGTAGDGKVTWQHALDFVLGVNYSGTYPNCGAGLTNWHLPNRKQLLSLHDYAQDSPILPLGHPFTNVNIDFYWSSTTKAGSTNTAWRDSLEEGFIFADLKTVNNYVWPVHSAIEVSSTPIPTPTNTPTPTKTPIPPGSYLKIYLPLINRD